MSISFYIATADSTEMRMDYDHALPENDIEGCQLNLANANAANLFRAVGMVSEPCGFILRENLAKVRSAVVYALNTREGRAHLEREGYGSQGELGCRVIEMPTADDYAERTLRRFLVFLARASELGRHIYWG